MTALDALSSYEQIGANLGDNACGMSKTASGNTRALTAILDGE